MHACATSALRPAGGSSSSVTEQPGRATVTMTSSAALASTAPLASPEIARSNDQDQQDDQALRKPSMIVAGRVRPSMRPSTTGARRWRSEPTPETSRRGAWHRQPRSQHRAAETDHDHDQRSSIRSSWRLPGPSTLLAVRAEADSALAADQPASWLAYEDRNLGHPAHPGVVAGYVYHRIQR